MVFFSDRNNLGAVKPGLCNVGEAQVQLYRGQGRSPAFPVQFAP